MVQVETGIDKESAGDLVARHGGELIDQLVHPPSPFRRLQGPPLAERAGERTAAIGLQNTDAACRNQTQFIGRR